jgi:transcriptional regulator with XRE-family HTH domain
MFDMQQVSKTISRLRKARNMTQMELADKMNISFQAVSNWERGQTMPDIAKLSELADILDVTIDELLGNTTDTEMLKKLIRDEPMQEEISAEEFLNVAPITKPVQAEKLWENVKTDATIAELAEAAPFLSESVLDALTVKAIRREKSFDGLMELLPFISSEAMGTCVDFMLEDGAEFQKIVKAAPFLSEDTINSIAARVLKEGDVDSLVMLAPFMEQNRLAETAADLIGTYGFSRILPILPFLDKSRLDDLIINRDKDRGKANGN